ncbi:MAG: hypothetical protein U0796_15535 [Gemmatales bacterium]
MRVRRSSVLLAAGLLTVVAQTGCEPARALTTNLIVNPLKWDYYSDGVGRHIRDSSLADEAWEEICARDGDVYSRHYRRGFHEGFRDYLNMGGTGDPPTLPPRSYWRIYYQTPEGHDAIQDWFEGFRHGTSVAKASGVRGYVTVPLSSLPPSETVTQESDEPPRAPEKDKEPKKVPDPGTTKPPEKEGPVKPPVVTPPKTADGRPMPPPVPPIIQVERMIAPPIPSRQTPPR